MRLLPLLFLVPALVGCRSRDAATPAEAHARLAAAVATHDGARLWGAIDEETRWSWMSVQRAWREAYDITLSVVPEGPERNRLLARFEAGATSEDARSLFERMLRPEDWSRLQALLAAAGSRRPEMPASGTTSEIVTPAGPLLYRKGQSQHSGWGYAGLASRAEQIKFSATADLERMRKDAADYESAATRGRT